jgi:hypothetical protein
MAGLALYLLFEFPMRRLLQWSVLPKISSDKWKHSYFSELYNSLKDRVVTYVDPKEFKAGNKSRMSAMP